MFCHSPHEFTSANSPLPALPVPSSPFQSLPVLSSPPSSRGPYLRNSGSTKDAAGSTAAVEADRRRASQWYDLLVAGNGTQVNPDDYRLTPLEGWFMMIHGDRAIGYCLM